MIEERPRKNALFVGCCVLGAFAALVVLLLVPQESPARVTMLYFLPAGAVEGAPVLRSGMLVPVAFPVTAGGATGLSNVVHNLLAGPGSTAKPDLSSAIPTGTGVRAVYARANIVFVDLDRRFLASRPGTPDAILARAQLVATLRAAFPATREVIVLIDGKTIPGFSY